MFVIVDLLTFFLFLPSYFPFLFLVVPLPYEPFPSVLKGGSSLESLLGAPRDLFRGSLGPLGCEPRSPSTTESRCGVLLGRPVAIVGRHGALFGPSRGSVGPSWSSLGTALIRFRGGPKITRNQRRGSLRLLENVYQPYQTANTSSNTPHRALGMVADRLREPSSSKPHSR